MQINRNRRRIMACNNAGPDCRFVNKHAIEERIVPSKVAFLFLVLDK